MSVERGINPAELQANKNESPHEKNKREARAAAKIAREQANAQKAEARKVKRAEAQAAQAKADHDRIDEIRESLDLAPAPAEPVAEQAPMVADKAEVAAVVRQTKKERQQSEMDAIRAKAESGADLTRKERFRLDQSNKERASQESAKAAEKPAEKAVAEQPLEELPADALIPAEDMFEGVPDLPADEPVDLAAKASVVEAAPSQEAAVSGAGMKSLEGKTNFQKARIESNAYFNSEKGKMIEAQVKAVLEAVLGEEAKRAGRPLTRAEKDRFADGVRADLAKRDEDFAEYAIMHDMRSVKKEEKRAQRDVLKRGEQFKAEKTMETLPDDAILPFEDPAEGMPALPTEQSSETRPNSTPTQGVEMIPIQKTEALPAPQVDQPAPQTSSFFKGISSLFSRPSKEARALQADMEALAAMPDAVGAEYVRQDKTGMKETVRRGGSVEKTGSAESHATSTPFGSRDQLKRFGESARASQSQEDAGMVDVAPVAPVRSKGLFGRLRESLFGPDKETIAALQANETVSAEKPQEVSADMPPETDEQREWFERGLQETFAQDGIPAAESQGTVQRPTRYEYGSSTDALGGRTSMPGDQMTKSRGDIMRASQAREEADQRRALENLAEGEMSGDKKAYDAYVAENIDVVQEYLAAFDALDKKTPITQGQTKKDRDQALVKQVDTLPQFKDLVAARNKAYSSSSGEAKKAA